MLQSTLSTASLANRAITSLSTDRFSPSEPSPAFDGRFVLLEAVNPAFVQRLFVN